MSAVDGLKILVEQVERAASLVPTSGKYCVEGVGLLAAYRKRIAEFQFRVERIPQERQFDASIQRLNESLLLYERCFREATRLQDNGCAVARIPIHWPATQALSLAAVLGRRLDVGLFTTDVTLTKVDIGRGYADAELWALTSLVELAVLASWLGIEDHGLERPSVISQRLVELSGNSSGAVHSTARQLERYTYWWWQPDFRSRCGTPDVSETLRAELHETVQILHDFERDHAGAFSLTRRR